MKKKFMKIFFLNMIAALFFLLFNLLSSTSFIVFNQEYYEKEFFVNGVNDLIDKNTTSTITKGLINYFKTGNNSFLNSSFFSQRDLLHLVDVRDLINKCLFHEFLCGAIFLFFLMLVFAYNKRKFFENSALIFAVSSLALLVFFIFFIITKQSFHTEWVLFHEILFNNDLWLLNPRTDKLIVLFPETFFYKTIKLIFLISIFKSFLLFIISLLTGVIFKKIHKKDKSKKRLF